MTVTKIDLDDYKLAKRCVTTAASRWTGAQRVDEDQPTALMFAAAVFGMDPEHAYDLLRLTIALTPPGEYVDNGELRPKADALRARALFHNSWPLPTAAELSRPESALSRVDALIGKPIELGGVTIRAVEYETRPEIAGPGGDEWEAQPHG